MSLRILVLGRLDGDLRREVGSLGGGAEILDLAEGDAIATAIRSVSPDLAVIVRPASHPAFLESAALDALASQLEHEYLRSVR